MSVTKKILSQKLCDCCQGSDIVAKINNICKWECQKKKKTTQEVSARFYNDLHSPGNESSPILRSRVISRDVNDDDAASRILKKIRVIW